MLGEVKKQFRLEIQSVPKVGNKILTILKFQIPFFQPHVPNITRTEHIYFTDKKIYIGCAFFRRLQQFQFVCLYIVFKSYTHVDKYHQKKDKYYMCSAKASQTKRDRWQTNDARFS